MKKQDISTAKSIIEKKYMKRADELDKWKRRLRSYAFLTIAALAFAIGIQIFVSIPGTFSSGLGAFALVLTYVWDAVSSYFAIIYLIINIPGIIWSYFYNSKKFTYRTAYFLVIQSLVSIPFIIRDDLYELIAENLWGFESLEAIQNQMWPLIIIPALGGIFVGSATGLAWKSGGSTAGIDIATHYFSTKRKLSIGHLTRILAYSILVVSITITFSLNKDQLEFWFLKIVGTILFIQTNSMMIDQVYPKYKKVEIQIFTRNKKAISNYLKSASYKHAYNLIKVSTGVDKEKYLFTSVVLLLEVRKMTRYINQIEPNAWIKTAKVQKVYGIFNSTTIEDDN